MICSTEDLMDSKRDADRRIIVLEEELSNLRAALAKKSELPSPDIIEAGIQTEPELPLPLEPCQTGSDNSDELSEAYDMLQTELDDLKAKFQEVSTKVALLFPSIVIVACRK